MARSEGQMGSREGHDRHERTVMTKRATGQSGEAAEPAAAAITLEAHGDGATERERLPRFSTVSDMEISRVPPKSYERPAQASSGGG